MDPISTIGTGIETAKLAREGWGWWQHLRNGTVNVTHPTNRSTVESEWVTFEGVHKRAKKPGAHFWLISIGQGNKYWLHGEIELDPDGRWKASMSVGPSPGPRSCVILLVKVNDFINELFQDIKDRSRKAEYHGPVV